MKKARGWLARPTLISFCEPEGNKKASDQQQAKGMTDEKGTRMAGKTNAHFFLRAGGKQKNL